MTNLLSPFANLKSWPELYGFWIYGDGPALVEIADKYRGQAGALDASVKRVREGIRGKRAIEWRLVDQIAPRSRFAQVVTDRAHKLAAEAKANTQSAPGPQTGITLESLLFFLQIE